MEKPISSSQLHTIKEQKSSPPIFDGQLYTADWLEDQTFPDLQFAVQGIVPEGLSLLVGSPKVGKSWISLSIALAVASGQTALGHISTSPRPVLLLALEDGRRRMQSRISSLLRGSLSHYPQRLEIVHRIVEQRLIDDIKKWVYDHYDPLHPESSPLVILDTLGKAAPQAKSNESVYTKDYRIGSDFKGITDDYPGSSLMALHHDRKAESEDFVDSVSGSNALSGSADTIIIMQRSRNEDTGFLNVTGRDVEENKYSIVKDPQTNQWQLAAPTLHDSANFASTAQAQLHIGDNMKAVMEFVIQNQPTSTSQVAQEFGRNASVWLGRLAEDGKITKIKRGLYAGPSIPYRDTS